MRPPRALHLAFMFEVEVYRGAGRGPEGGDSMIMANKTQKRDGSTWGLEHNHNCQQHLPD